ncbi:hypothetical protein GOODEAATRI_021857 [Goodea atripinnis]|uniref:Uncharacterized protein n=1 Tax=Goodea atripinnis TaxID=208336 RepID=A0ABV0NE47_9TELE
MVGNPDILLPETLSSSSWGSNDVPRPVRISGSCREFWVGPRSSPNQRTSTWRRPDLMTHLQQRRVLRFDRLEENLHSLLQMKSRSVDPSPPICHHVMLKLIRLVEGYLTKPFSTCYRFQSFVLQTWTNLLKRWR